MSAYVDESMRVSAGLYLMAAVMVSPLTAEAHRETLRGLLLRRQRRLHWRDENDRRRTRLISAVADLEPHGIVVIATGLDPRRQERGRRKCIERLLWELGDSYVSDVIFERRSAEFDLRDRELVAALQGRHAMPPRLRLSWEAAEKEPLLWLADIVAGAAALMACG